MCGEAGWERERGKVEKPQGHKSKPEPTVTRHYRFHCRRRRDVCSHPLLPISSLRTDTICRARVLPFSIGSRARVRHCFAVISRSKPNAARTRPPVFSDSLSHPSAPLVSLAATSITSLIVSLPSTPPLIFLFSTALIFPRTFKR